LKLKTPWHDGTTHVLYEPLDFVAKLAALVPRPHKNLVLYHGVLAANASWRSRVVQYGRAAVDDAGAPLHHEDPCLPRYKRRQWAEMMHRAFALDVLACPRCGGRLRLLALIIERGAIKKLLAHAGHPTDPPAPTPWRAPPESEHLFDDIA
jgi:Putative transposase